MINIPWLVTLLPLPVTFWEHNWLFVYTSTSCLPNCHLFHPSTKQKKFHLVVNYRHYTTSISCYILIHTGPKIASTKSWWIRIKPKIELTLKIIVTLESALIFWKGLVLCEITSFENLACLYKKHAKKFIWPYTSIDFQTFLSYDS